MPVTVTPSPEQVDINTWEPLSRWAPWLVLAAFANGTDAYVYVGHLSAMAGDLGMSTSSAGQLAALYAGAYALAAPLGAHWLGRVPRNSVLALLLALLATLAIAASKSTSGDVLFPLRLLSGVCAGVIGALCTSAALARARPIERRRAFAVVMGGTTLAFLLGIPLGSVIGDFFGWRASFLWAASLATLACLGLLVGLCRPRPVARSAPTDRVAHTSAGRPDRWLLVTALGFAATFTVMAYVGPVVEASTGLTGSGVATMQLLVGMGSLLGLWLGSRSQDRDASARLLRRSCLVSVGALALYSAPLFHMVPNSIAPAFVALLMVTGAASLFARMPLIQAGIAEAAPTRAPFFLGLNASAIFVGQSLGAALGGVAIALLGLPALGLAAASVALLAWAIATRLPSHPNQPARSIALNSEPNP